MLAHIAAGFSFLAVALIAAAVVQIFGFPSALQNGLRRLWLRYGLLSFKIDAVMKEYDKGQLVKELSKGSSFTGCNFGQSSTNVWFFILSPDSPSEPTFPGFFESIREVVAANSRADISELELNERAAYQAGCYLNRYYTGATFSPLPTSV